MPRIRTTVCSLLVVSMATAAAGIAVAASPGTKSKPIGAKATTSNGFAPKSVKVKPGATVYWKNLDGAPHNAVANKKVKGKPAFTSGSATTGNFKAKAPKAPGKYAYICTVHPFMKGTLIVVKKT